VRARSKSVSDASPSTARSRSDELLHVLAEAQANDAIRVIVIEGDGKTFCAGATLRR